MKKKNKSLYMEILYTLYLKGIGFETDITKCFDKFSLEADNIFELLKSTRKEKLEEYLRLLETNGHIIESSVYEKRTSNNGTKKWIMGEFNIYATLTVQGHLLIDNYMLNEKTKESILFQKGISITSLLIAVVAILATAWPYMINSKNENKLSNIENRVKLIEHSQKKICSIKQAKTS